jgi:branched-chain amino acid transport system substrate-binding protein
MSNKLVLFVALAALLGLITACSSSSSVPASVSSSTGAKFSCTDRLGCIDIGPNEPVHIAYAAMTTGVLAPGGLDIVYGAELAIDAAGGRVLGHAIKFDGEDSGCTPEGGQIAAEKIAADKTVVAVVGPACSSEARAAGAILLTQAGLSMISPASTAPDLTDPKIHVAGFFRTAHNDKVQGAVSADFAAQQLKSKRAATIDDGSIYGQGLAGVFVDQFRKDGGTITAQEALNVGDKDMKPLLTRVATGKPDLIYYPIFAEEGGYICAQIRDVPGLEKTIMMGADGTYLADFMKACGTNVVGMFWSSPNYSAFGGEYPALVQKYLKKYNVKAPLGPYHAHAYDAMTMELQALQKPNVVVKDSDGTLHVHKQAFRDAIAATDMQGMTGHIQCDANGDCADPKIAIYQATQDNLANLVMPQDPVWFPGGPGYKP